MYFAIPVEFVDNSDVLLSVAACNALGELGRTAQLPLPDESGDGATELSKKDVVDKLIKKVKTDNVHHKVWFNIHVYLDVFKCQRFGQNT